VFQLRNRSNSGNSALLAYGIMRGGKR